MIKYNTETLGLQAFAFCVINLNDEDMKPRFKRKVMG